MSFLLGTGKHNLEKKDIGKVYLVVMNNVCSVEDTVSRDEKTLLHPETSLVRRK